MPEFVDVSVKSNDGTTMAPCSSGTYNTISGMDTDTYNVTSSGVFVSGTSNGYGYGGDKEFIGVSSSANTTTPDYPVGSSFTLGSVSTLYIVEYEEYDPTSDKIPKMSHLKMVNDRVLSESQINGLIDTKQSGLSLTGIGATKLGSVGTVQSTITLPNAFAAYIIVTTHASTANNVGIWIVRSTSGVFKIGGGSNITITKSNAALTVKSTSGNSDLYAIKLG